MYKLVCIGGTGQLVLHYYCLLHLSGLIKEPFDAVVIDRDELLPSLEQMKALFDLLPTGGAQSFGMDVPKIRYSRLEIDGAGTVNHLLMRADQALGAAHTTAADALFDPSTLAANPDRGLYFRPAVSSVVRVEADDLLLAPHGEAVVAVASILGGTGAGLYLKVIDRIHAWSKERGVQDPNVRLALVGEYFAPDPQRGDVPRLRSNQYFAARALLERKPPVKKFCVLGGPGSGQFVRPDTNRDRIGLPEIDSHPIWAAVVATRFLATDVISAAAADFKDREMEGTPGEDARRLTLGTFRETIGRAFAAAGALSSRGVLSAIAAESARDAVWGRELPRMADFLRRSSGGTGTWARDVDLAMSDLWKNLKLAMPVDVPPAKSPKELRVRHWPARADGIGDKAHFDNNERSVRRSAANLLYHCLRGV